jgi:hypothetical protein
LSPVGSLVFGMQRTRTGALPPCVRNRKSSTATECKKPIAMDGLGSMWATWSGKRGSNSRPIPWQGIALPTELFPRRPMKKPTANDGPFKLVAWGGIEPPTQGFSKHILVRTCSVSTRNIQSNQALTVHSTAVKRIHSHLIPIASVRFCVRQMRWINCTAKFDFHAM